MELKSRAFRTASYVRQYKMNNMRILMMISDFYAFHSKNHPFLYASYNTQRKSKRWRVLKSWIRVEIEFSCCMPFRFMCNEKGWIMLKNFIILVIENSHFSYLTSVCAHSFLPLHYYLSALFFSYQRLKYSIHDLGIGIRDVINLLMVWMIGFVKLYFMLYSYLFILCADIIHWAVRLVD